MSPRASGPAPALLLSLAVLAATAPASACRSFPAPEPLDTRSEFLAAKQRVSGPLPWRLAVAPVTLEAQASREADDAAAGGPAPANGTEAGADAATKAQPRRALAKMLGVSGGFEGELGGAAGATCALPETLDQELRSACEGLGLFRSVAGLRPPAGETPPTREALLAEARQSGADLLLVPSVRLNRVRFVKHKGNWWLGLAAWVAFWWPEWFVADEVYAAELAIEATVFHVRTGAVLVQPLIKGEREAALDDFQRGWHLWGIWLAPDELSQADYEKVGRLLLPHAAQDALAGFAASLTDELGRIDIRQAIPADLVVPETFAVVIGVEDYAAEGLGSATHARADAAAVAELLAGPRMGVPSRNIALLLDGDASALAIREALQAALQDKILSGDRVLVYAAGLGATAIEPGGGAGRYFLPHGADKDKVRETGIPLKELAEALRASPAVEAALILDCSFGGQTAAAGDRSFGGEAAPAGSRTASVPAAAPAGLNDLARIVDEAGRAVLLAASPDEAALAPEDLGHGLFTGQLLRALRGEGDEDRDGVVTLEEAFGFAEALTSRYARFQGGTQTPLWPGKKRLAMRLSGGRK